MVHTLHIVNHRQNMQSLMVINEHILPFVKHVLYVWCPHGCIMWLAHYEIYFINKKVSSMLQAITNFAWCVCHQQQAHSIKKWEKGCALHLQLSYT